MRRRTQWRGLFEMEKAFLLAVILTIQVPRKPQESFRPFSPRFCDGRYGSIGPLFQVDAFRPTRQKIILSIHQSTKDSATRTLESIPTLWESVSSEFGRRCLDFERRRKRSPIFTTTFVSTSAPTRNASTPTSVASTDKPAIETDTSSPTSIATMETETDAPSDSCLAAPTLQRSPGLLFYDSIYSARWWKDASLQIHCALA